MSVTLSTLRTRARQIADMENSQFIANAELDTYLNTAYMELYDILVNSFEDYFVGDPTAVAITSGNTANLPTDFYKLRALDFNLNGAWSSVKLFNFSNRNGLKRVSFLYATPDSGRRYRIMGNKLIIQNTDNAVGNYQLWYVPSPTVLSLDADALPLDLTKSGWEEYIVLYAAERMLSKEESSTTDVVRRRGEIAARIEKMAADRQAEQSEQISDSTQTVTYTGWYEY